MTEDEMAGWHHWLDGRESQWTPGVGDGQGGLAKSRTRLSDWSDLISKKHSPEALVWLWDTRNLRLTYKALTGISNAFLPPTFSSKSSLLVFSKIEKGKMIIWVHQVMVHRDKDLLFWHKNDNGNYKSLILTCMNRHSKHSNRITIN